MPLPMTTIEQQGHLKTHLDKIEHISGLVQVNSRPQAACECHNHWLAFSTRSDNSFKAPLSDCPQKPKSNRSVVVDLATKPLTPISTGLVCACQPHSLTSATSSAYFSVFLSNASSIASSKGIVNSIKSLTLRIQHVWSHCSHNNTLWNLKWSSDINQESPIPYLAVTFLRVPGVHFSAPLAQNKFYCPYH